MKSCPPAPDCWYLTGPTAAGKSSISLELAERLGAEIVSLDSMAVYREMDIGTAKPDRASREQVPHHLVDFLCPTEEYSVWQYIEQAHATIEEIKSRGREVLFVGGTPLYLKALLRGIFEGPSEDRELRERIEAEALAEGPLELHARVAEVDPVTAKKLHPNDTRRLVRALEVYEKTGQPISDFQNHFAEGRAAEVCRVFVIDWPRPVLHERINQRVDQMFAGGLVEEVQQLLTNHGALGRTAAQAVGYREVLAHFEGEYDLAFAIERTKARTRQFARRQLIWYRGLSECRWVPVADPLDPKQIAAEILASARA